MCFTGIRQGLWITPLTFDENGNEVTYDFIDADVDGVVDELYINGAKVEDEETLNLATERYNSELKRAVEYLETSNEVK